MKIKQVLSIYMRWAVRHILILTYYLPLDFYYCLFRNNLPSVAIHVFSTPASPPPPLFSINTIQQLKLHGDVYSHLPEIVFLSYHFFFVCSIPSHFYSHEQHLSYQSLPPSLLSHLTPATHQPSITAWKQSWTEKKKAVVYCNFFCTPAHVVYLINSLYIHYCRDLLAVNNYGNGRAEVDMFCFRGGYLFSLPDSGSVCSCFKLKLRMYSWICVSLS